MQQDSLTNVFSAEGPLAKAFSHYVPRAQQLGLSQAVADALQQRGMLVAEAGTGTGKTWAYLLPVLLGQEKALISTGTRTLQDQLYHRDLPQLCQALDLVVQTALLKGRSNYLCHYYFDRVANEQGALASSDEVRQFQAIRLFMQQTETGDKSELNAVPEHAPIWHKVTSTRENCHGQDCPFINDCFVYKARRRAQEADVVVVNHALFMADWALREEGVCDLLPETQAVIFDEAHHLPATATRFLGTTVSSYQLSDFSKAVGIMGQAHAPKVQDWLRWADRIKQSVQDLRLLCEPVQREKGQKSTFEYLPNAQEVDKEIERLLDTLRSLVDIFAQLQDKDPELKALYRQAADLFGRLFLWTQPDRQGEIAADPLLDGPIEAQLAQPSVRWVENNAQMLRFHRAPLTVDHIFTQAKHSEQAWIFTSATLSVRGDFSHFIEQLGLEQAQTCDWPSPFNYAEQAALYVPQQMPLAHSREFNARFVALLWPLVQATEGGVLVLCTTLRAVDDIAERLHELNEQENTRRLILQQGKQSRSQLLTDFSEGERAILVGSASFWEGVDFPGDALTVVAIDKLPFAPPDDPVMSARIEQCRREGGNPFMAFQLPEAAIALKQGAGRLIRSEQDHGVLMIADTRIVEKSYGRRLWQGLPPFTRTRNLQEALVFVGQKPRLSE